MQSGTHPRWGVLAMGLATFTLMGFGQGLIGPALPEMTRRFALPEGAAGLLVSAQWIGSAAGVAVMYQWSRHVSIRLAMALLAAGGAGLALQPGWLPVLLAAVVFGTGYGLSTAVFNPRVLRAFGGKGASMLSLLNASYAAGAIISPIAFVLLGNSSAPAFGFAAIAFLMICLLATDRRGSETPAVVAEGGEGIRLHWPILGFAAVGIGLEACLVGLGPLALVRAGQGESDAAGLLSAFFVAFLLARVTLGMVAHHIASFTIYVAAILMMLIASLVAVTGLIGPAFVAMGVSAGMFFPAVFVTGTRKMGDDPRVTSIILGAGLVGGIGLPPILSAVSAGLGPLGLFWCVLGISVPTALAALAVARNMAR